MKQVVYNTRTSEFLCKKWWVFFMGKEENITADVLYFVKEDNYEETITKHAKICGSPEDLLLVELKEKYISKPLRNARDIPDYKEKAKFLLDNGWIDLWHDDDWVKSEWYKDPSINIDWAGVDTESAYRNCLIQKLDKETSESERVKILMSRLGNIGSEYFNKKLIEIFNDEFITVLEETPLILDLIKRYATTHDLKEILKKLDK